MPFNYFPYQPTEAKAMNPAIQLFGNRFYADQTVSELLVEFLLLVLSAKRIGAEEFDSPLPDNSRLKAWHNERLEYAPRARLNLKLFSFIGASRLDSRHQTHREHYQTLIETLRQRINIAEGGNPDDTIRTIENLFLGFQGAGSGRTWCAQSFLPVSPGFLAGESIWKESKARNDNVEDWAKLIKKRSSYFDMNQHLFLARGGELLYLQICNALQQPREKIVRWCKGNDFGLSSKEQDPAWLRVELNEALGGLMRRCPDALTALAEFIDAGLDAEAPAQTDGTDDKRRFVGAGWCNAESWPEGYLFAVELLRLLKSNLDIVDHVYLLETACAMQTLRSLAAQSARARLLRSEPQTAKPNDYRFVVSAPKDDRNAIRRLSQQSVRQVEKMIFQALRSPEITLSEVEKDRKRFQKQADKSYGGKLFIGLAKRIGFIVPKRGGGARFVLNEHLLRLLVVTTIPVGGRLTFDTFKKLLENRYGLVFDADGLDRADRWLNGQGIYLPADTDLWLREMLEAAGFLIHLSDSCALVHNPANSREDG